MGYRSYGRMVFGGDKVDVETVVAGLKLRADEVMLKALDEMVLWAEGDDAYFALDFDSWKWYSDYPDIQAFEKIWSTFREAHDERDAAVSGGFIRVGEDDDDVERRWFGDATYDLVNSHVVVDGIRIPEKSEDLRNTR